MKRTVVFTGALVALIGSANAALACKCAVTSREAAMSAAAVVFQGQVVNVATSGGSQVTTMRVTRAIKGVSSGATVKVRSRTASAACGYDFRGKRSVLVGGERAGGAISARRCTMYNLNN